MDDKSADVATLITRIQNGDQLDLAGLTDWLVSLLMAGARSPGFWSSEILPPTRSETKDWTLVQRFHSLDQAKTWQQSPSRQTLLTNIKNIGCGDKAAILDEISEDGSVGSAVTAIVTDIKAGQEEEYWAWENKIQMAQARFPGYGGVYVQPPPPGKPGQWTTLLRFDSPKALEQWFNADQRKELLDEGTKFARGTRFHKIESSFPGFFPSESSGGQTPQWKAATMVVIGLFPILELLKVFFAPLTASLTFILGMAISTVLSVSLVTFVSMPILVKQFNWWLAPDSEHATRETDMKGLLLALLIFAVEIAIGWRIS